MASTMISTLDRSGHGAIGIAASVLAVLLRRTPLADAENFIL
jgi:hypothetical protein